MRREQSNWPPAIITMSVILFVILGAMWLEDRFSPTVALAIGIVLGGSFLIIVGWMLALATMRSTLQASSDWNHDMASTERYRQLTLKELVRGDSAERSARARIDVIDAKRVDAIAQQRAGLLVDLERQKYQQPAGSALQWGDEEDDKGSFQTWE